MSKRKKKKPLKVVIGTATGGSPKMEFVQSLWDSKNHRNVVDFITNQSSRIAHNRNNVVRSFLDTDADALLFIDDDMKWEQFALDKLFERYDPVKAPIVGGLCFGWDSGLVFTTIMYESPVTPGKYVRAGSFPKDDLLECDATGAAFLLIGRHVLEKIAEDREGYPWFAEEVVHGIETGEDVIFCRRAKEAGFPIQIATAARTTHVKGPLGVNIDTYITQVNRDKFIITGSGRCGTGYMAAVLNAMNVPTGHEDVFNPENLEELPIRWSAWRGDSSWMAAPYLQEFFGMIFHVVRHPLQVVSSMAAGPWFKEPNPYGEFSFQKRGLPEKYDDIGEIARHVWEWNKMIEPHAHYRINIETANDDTFRIITHEIRTPRSDARIEAALERVPRDVNKYGAPYRMWNYDELGVWGPRLREMAAEYGYKE